MTVTIDLGTLLPNLASLCVIVGSVYGLWRFARRSWNRPDPPAT